MRVVLRSCSLGWLGALAGCIAMLHGATTEQYRDRVLRARTGPGAQRMQMEVGFDSALRGYVQANGEPDYIQVLSAQVRFEIAPDGSITGARLEHGSGNATFDRAAVQAVTSVATLSPVPARYAADLHTFVAEFRGQGGVSQGREQRTEEEPHASA